METAAPMDDGLRVVFDMNASCWSAVQNSLEGLSEDETRWRPVPEANSIGVIVRHLRIEAEWHVHSLDRGEPMPTVAVSPPQEAIDAVTDDFRENVTRLEEACARFLELLRATSLNRVQELTAAAYGKVADADGRRHFLAYHHAIHLAMHCGQIRMIRNLYSKSRGEAARFVPENPTYRVSR
jgi:hypothetical protein